MWDPASAIGRRLGLALIGILAVSCGSEPESAERIATVQSAIQGGVADPIHPFAVGIYDTVEGAICSGALIAPNLVLTARHCVADVSDQVVDCMTTRFEKEREPTELWVTASASLTPHQGGTVGRRVFVPRDATFCGKDIALLELRDKLAEPSAQFVVPVIDGPMTDRNRYGLRVTAIGYGVTSPAGEGGGARRIRQNIDIQCIPGDPQIPCGVAHGVEPAEFVTGDGTCQGDSGSSAYEQLSFDRGNPVSLGVLSRGGQTGETCVGAVYTRADQFKDLVVRAVRQAAIDGDYPPPEWAHIESIPNEGEVGIVTLGALGVSCKNDEQCTSGVCVQAATDGICSQLCGAATDTCPRGYQCVDGEEGARHCLPDSSVPTPVYSATGGSGGCSAFRAPSSEEGARAPWLLGLALGVVATVRRRRP